MKNWKLLAEAGGLGIPEADMVRLTPLLEKLDEAFRGISASFPADVDSALVFDARTETE